MNLLQLQNGIKRFGARVLFDGARFSINAGEHVGVIGPNGAGKTTLFKILVGQESLEGGEITKSTQLKIGYLEQEAKEPLDVSAEDHLSQVSLKPIWELKQLGRNLGLDDSHFSKPFAALSGGYRMRMKLLALIGQEPNLMLLDEPTNFLDLESIMALESFLQSYDGAFLLISHDREFLRRTTDHTLEVEEGEITKFPGNIDDYFEQKAQLRQILSAQAANQELKRKSIQDFVDRFGAKATKARQAQSRMKQLEKMEKIEIKDLPVRAKIKIPPPRHTGKETLVLENATLGYGDRPILRDVNLRLEKGAHLGVVGFNGAGKSTLLKTLAGRLPLLSGSCTLGYQVSLSYYAQHVSEDLNPQHTVLEALESAAQKDIDRQEILNLAGSLLFSGDAVKKKIHVLSGGEKSRVALGQILLKRAPLLLLDEPTNHLDFDTVEAMTEALKSYPGTVVVVSHDRGFIGRIATKILEINNGRADVYPGTYDDYLWSLERGVLKDRVTTKAAPAAPAAKEQAPPPKVTAPSAENRDRSRHFQAQAKELQKRIAKNETLLEKQTARLAQLNDEAVASPAKAFELSLEISKLSDSITKLEEELLQQMESLAEAEKQIEKLL